MRTEKNKLKAIPKPFVKWAGGKGQLLSTIEKELPQSSFDCYVEPFAGGGAMLFWVLSNFPLVEKVVINDINSDLTNAYLTVRNNVRELINTLKDIQKEYFSLKLDEERKKYFLQKRERYNTKSLDSTENTALFIFLNRTCFNGLYRVNSKGLFNVPFGKYANPTICDEGTLQADSRLLQKVEILTGDFEQTIRYADHNVFFYIDPPYKPLTKTSAFTSYAKENFDDEEQIRLKKFCDTISDKGAWWILSNSDVEIFDDLYSGYQIDRVLAARAINSNAEKRGKLTEILIKNYIHKIKQAV